MAMVEIIEQDIPNKRMSLPWTLVLILSITLLVLIIGFFIWRSNHVTSPLPKSVIEQINFSIYYPSDLPEKYSYDEDSASYTNNSLIYTLDGPSDVIITQQPNPKEKILFEKLGGFTPTGTPVGQAYIGEVNERLVVLAQTSTTLITITASLDTPKTVLSEITQNLSETGY